MSAHMIGVQPFALGWFTLKRPDDIMNWTTSTFLDASAWCRIYSPWLLVSRSASSLGALDGRNRKRPRLQPWAAARRSASHESSVSVTEAPFSGKRRTPVSWRLVSGLNRELNRA